MTMPGKRRGPSDAQRRFANPDGGGPGRRTKAPAATRARQARQQERDSLRLRVEAALREREREIVDAWQPHNTGTERP